MPRPLRKIKRLSLYKSLQLGYLRNEAKQAKRLKRFGYVVDKDLTNNERMVAYNPFTKKTIFVENGSQTRLRDPAQFVEDWANNITRVPFGNFEKSQRFKDAQNAYLKAKEKYKDTQFTLVGHSQSAITVNDLAGKGDRGVTYNGALFTKTKDNKNVTNYRSKNDIVSAFANPNDMKTLASPVTQNPISAHNIENIKELPVFV